MSRHTAWLTKEIGQWLRDGLIDDAAATAIRSRYPADAGSSWGLYLVSAIGAVVFGLGVVLFFAYNWADFPKSGKLALVFFAVVLAHGMAMWLHRRHPPSHNLVEGFHLVGSMMFGAGIWLIAQIYNIDEHYPTAFLVWGLGALTMAWAIPSVLQALLAAVLIGTWGVAEAVDFDNLHLASIGWFAVGIVPLAWHLRSRTLLLAGLVGFIGLTLLNIGSHLSDTHVFNLLFCTGLVMIAASGPLAQSRFPGSASVLRGMGVLLYGLQLFMLTFFTEDILHSEILLDSGLAASGVTGSAVWLFLGLTSMIWIVLLVPAARVRFRSDPSITRVLQHHLILASLLMLILYNLGVFSTSLNVIHVAFNLILAAQCVLLIIRGTDNLKWKQVALGFLTLGALIQTWFTDLFDSLLMRSLAFIIIGLLLFLIGHQYSRRRMKEQVHA
jgi:uncharacterized membrane protein